MKIFKSPHLWIVVFIIIFFSSCLLASPLDLRNFSDESGEYEIAFCARPSADTKKNIPGHAFVSFSYYSPKGNRTFTSIGHTVQSGTSMISAIWSYFGVSVDGFLSEEKYTSIKQSCLVVKVNKSDYDAAYSLAEDPLKKLGIVKNSYVLESYKLGSEDCVGFLIKVAKKLESKGFIVPKRNNLESPLDYIQRLINSNTLVKPPTLWELFEK